MTPTPTPTSIKFAGSYAAAQPGNDSDTRTQVPAAPAIHLCPKCSTSMRSYTRKDGTQWLQCRNRRACNLHLPIADAPAPDHGLTDLKPAPVAPAGGLAGLRTGVAADGFDLW